MLLLAPDLVTLYSGPPAADAHGWAAAPAAQVWQGQGNLQAGPGRSDNAAAAAGGHGPYDPAHSGLATLYLPPDVPLAEGMVALVGGISYALSQVRLAGDPVNPGTGGLGCWVATATEAGQWPA